MLEHLPLVDRTEWQPYAARLLSVGPDGTDDVLPALTEASNVLTAPDLAFLFADSVLSEVDISANIPELGGNRIAGAIDKLVISDDRVLAVDFKTNTIVPDSPALVPDGLLRQMGAYHSALQAIYPGRDVQTAILWTKTAQLMLLPHEIVRDALRLPTTS